MVIVKLVEINKEIRSFEISENPTVGNLLDMAGVSFVENQITINNNPVTRETRLNDGDRVFVGHRTKGNIPFEVQIIRVGSSEGIISLPAEDNMTVSNILAQLSPDRRATIYGSDGRLVYDMRNSRGDIITEDTVLSRPASGTERIILSIRTKGNE